jgi:Protein O-mannosyl-transferase TMEM260-like/TPR repeat
MVLGKKLTTKRGLLLSFILSFSVYLITTCPSIYLGDSGELTAAAFSLGIPHNSGYPLYCLVGKLFCLLPVGNIGFRLNLMSCFFSAASVCLVAFFILRMTHSWIAALGAGLSLAFAPVFWNQATCAEVYSLHTFLVILMITLLRWWDESREHYRLLLFVLVTGLSFGNHMQTVMLAPAVFFIILSGDRKALLDLRPFLYITIFFISTLLIYIYLPLRTGAGAAMHWGNPDSLDRFVAHVTAQSHRSGYVLNLSVADYLVRTKTSIQMLISQFNVLLAIAFWGWLKLESRRWKMFYLIVIIFDLSYTIFLNTISLDVTPFNLSTAIVCAILTGFGIDHISRLIDRREGVGPWASLTMKAACFLVPAVFLLGSFPNCDQSSNYTAYEHTQNIFRTLGHGDTLFLEGDNHFFPVLYGRVVEHAREDVILFDRQGIIYPAPYFGGSADFFYGKWEALRVILEEEIIRNNDPDTVHYAVFNPESITIPEGYRLIPYGLLHRVVREEENNVYRLGNVWRYYTNESFRDVFEKDFLHRQLAAHYYFRLGRYLVMSNDTKDGLKHIRDASKIGYDDYGVHSMVAMLLADMELFDEARMEFERAQLNLKDPSVVENNWGYYYYKKGEYDKAVEAFRKATGHRSNNFSYWKNLGHALYLSGKTLDAEKAFSRSLALNQNQADLQEFMKSHGLKAYSGG